MVTFNKDDDGIDEGVQCKGCGTFTRCKYNWCFGCCGDMRRIDGILYELAHCAELVAQTAELATVEQMGATPDLAWPDYTSEDPWEDWSNTLMKRINVLRQFSKRYL